MTTVWWTDLATELGMMGLGATDRGLAALLLPTEYRDRDATLRRWLGDVVLRLDPAPSRAAAEQLGEYLAGERHAFDLALDQRGTTFQTTVWDAVQSVPFGRTASYGQIAARIGQRSAVRAVGGANGINPLPIIVPCHRIVGSSGALTGYGGGIEMKQRLLAHEDAIPREGETWEVWAVRRSAARPGLLLGPRSTRIYCRPTCRYSRTLRHVPDQFDSVDEARAAGYRPCKVCAPV